MFDQERLAADFLRDRMTRERLQEILKPHGAYRDADDDPPLGEERVHFDLNQMHIGCYYNLPRALQHRSACDLFTMLLLDEISPQVLRSVNVVAGPERGAVELVHSVAHYLPVPEVKTVILRKVDLGLELPDYFQPGRDDRVLFVDVVLRSGHTIEASKRALAHAQIVAAGVLVNRAPASWSEERLSASMPVVSVIRDPMQFFSEDDCPWCRRGIKKISV